MDECKLFQDGSNRLCDHCTDAPHHLMKFKCLLSKSKANLNYLTLFTYCPSIEISDLESLCYTTFQLRNESFVSLYVMGSSFYYSL